MSVTAPYVPPGVTVTELTSPSVNPTLASPADVCIIGLPGDVASNGPGLAPITVTDTVIMGLGGSTSPIALPTLESLNSDAQLVAITSVANVLSPQVSSPAWPSPQPAGAGYYGEANSNPGTVTGVDYAYIANSQGPPDGPVANPYNGAITWVTPSNGGNIPENTLVNVTYTYVPSDYYNPIRLFDVSSVFARFGTPWSYAQNSSGVTVVNGINSQLSMAAQFAFANGAQSVICQPLFTRATPGNPATAQQPATLEDAALVTTWEDTLYILRPIVNLDIIVPVIGVDGVYVTSDSEILAIYETVQAHIAYQATNELYVMLIAGEDGTASPTELANLTPGASGSYTLIEHAQSLQSNYGNSLSSQVVLLNNSSFNLSVPGAYGGTIAVGGQYAAAAFAGSIAGRAVSSSMTRQYLSGFTSVNDPRTPANKNTDAGAGLCVLENFNGGIRCRQGITLDIIDGPARQEISVVRAKFQLMESIQQTLDSQVIGQIVADANSPLVVASAIGGILGLLQTAGTIVGYTAPTAALSSVTPTIITASFSYQPAFPLNYINVQFNLNLTNGTITTTSNTTS
jgi:hypothetical protein